MNNSLIENVIFNFCGIYWLGIYNCMSHDSHVYNYEYKKKTSSTKIIF